MLCGCRRRRFLRALGSTVGTEALRSVRVVPGDPARVVYPESRKRLASAYLRVFIWIQAIGLVPVIVIVIHALATE